MLCQAGFLGKILPDQAIGIFVRTPLPWALWITEVHWNTGLFRKFSMLGQLHSTIPGKGFT